MAMPVLTRQGARECIEKITEEKFFQSEPVFVKGRTDICALVGYGEKGVDSIFLIWKDWRGEIKSLKIGSYNAEGFLKIKEVIKTRTQLIIEVQHNGNGKKFGCFWISLKKLNLT